MIKSALSLLFCTGFALLLRGGSFSVNFQAPLQAGAEILRVLGENTASILGNIFTYKQIRIQGAAYHSEGEILRLADFDTGAPIWTLSPFEIEKRLKKLSWVEQVVVRTGLFPLQVDITLQEAEPWLVAELKEQSWLLSRQGKMLQSLGHLTNSRLILESIDLPRLSGVDSSERLDSAIAQIRYLQRAGGLPERVERYVLLDKGSGNGEGLVSFFSDIEFPSGHRRFPIRRAVFQIESDEAALDSLYRLEQVVQDLRRRGEAVEIADIRFDNQVILR